MHIVRGGNSVADCIAGCGAKSLFRLIVLEEMLECSGQFPTSLRSRRVSIQPHVDHATRGFI